MQKQRNHYFFSDGDEHVYLFLTASDALQFRAELPKLLRKAAKSVSKFSTELGVASTAVLISI